MTRVSVVIPAFNHARFIAECLRSVAAQGLPELELIVVDDGSSDETAAIARRELPRLNISAARLITQRNRGAHAALMRGIEESQGEVIALLNSDDLFLPGRLIRCLERLAKGDSALVFSGVRLIDAAGGLLPSEAAHSVWYRRALTSIETSPTIGFALLSANFAVSSGNLVFRRALYDAVGGFAPLRLSHDWDFLMQATRFTEPAFIPEPLLAYRVHGDNASLSIHHLIEREGRDVLARFVAACREGPIENPNAPCAEKWPRFFPRFVASRPFHTGTASIACYLPAVERD